MKRPLHLIEAGVITEQRYLGMTEAPARLTPALTARAEPAKRVRVPFLPRDRWLTAARESCRVLSDAVAASLKAGARCAVVGGECTIVAGSVSGALSAEPDLVLVYFDAHGDFNTVATTPSHFVGGMCLAHVCGRRLAPLLWPGARGISEDRVALVGARDLDPGEAGNLTNSKVKQVPFDRRHADAPGLLEFVRKRPVWVHVDVDVLDPREMPAVAFPAEGGPTSGALAQVLAALAAAADVRGLEICGYDPRRDDGNGVLPELLAKTVSAALS